jgi:hypothetical protein
VDDPGAYTTTLTTKRVFDFEQDGISRNSFVEDSAAFWNYQKKAGAEKK